MHGGPAQGRGKTKGLRNVTIPEHAHARGPLAPGDTIFFHPDYTVGPGVSPGHAFRLAGYTAGGELPPALKILIQLPTG